MRQSKMGKRRAARAWLSAVILLASCLMALTCRAAEETPAVTTRVSRIKLSGNLVLDITPQALFDAGFQLADVADVSIGDLRLTMPICADHYGVDLGLSALCVSKDSVYISAYGGEFADKYAIATKRIIDRKPGYAWDWDRGYDADVPVIIAMAQRQGYAREYAFHNFFHLRTNERGDYPGLTDAEYANYRMVGTTGVAPGRLYRSASPVNPALNRQREADRAMEADGIRTVMNMEDTLQEAEAYEGYGSTYYSRCEKICLGLDTEFFSDGFGRGLAQGFRFIATHDGPYLIHCMAGKDRTGFAVAILECLMGGGVDEIVGDYMRSFVNYYGFEVGSDQYACIAKGNIERNLATAFGIDDIHGEKHDLARLAREYLLQQGMNEEEIDALKAALGR